MPIFQYTGTNAEGKTERGFVPGDSMEAVAKRLESKGVKVEQIGLAQSYDPLTGDGSVVCDTDLVDYDLAPDALAGSIFRMLRQGQRVRFELDASGRATHLNLGSEVDMGTPDIPSLR